MDVNPLRDGLRIEPSPGPTTIVIFGASGDLTRRKLLPALYRLSTEQRLPPRLSVIGVARTSMDDCGFRKQFREAVVEDRQPEVASSFETRLYYMSGELDDPAVYTRLHDQISSETGTTGVLFYLAVPPAAYTTVI